MVSGGETEEQRLTTPSWDAGAGDLWIADRDPDDPRLLVLEKGAGEPVEVRVPGLDGSVEAVRVAGDGVRIALIVEKDGKRSLLIGRIERGEKGERPTVVEARSATPELEEVTAMSWAGDSRLVVVGRERGGVQQIGYVQVDGSTPEASVPAALTGVKDIARGRGRPSAAGGVLGGLVQSDGCRPGCSGRRCGTKGMAPVYPALLPVDSETKEPSVVYRRHAYDYGVIHQDGHDGRPDALPRGGRRARG
ncbi:Lipoprotein LpqB OS=Streptomyces fumanus OX=67302 GN=lpqB PE=3 SV=1 [Streptomyces fumanus]